MRARETIAAMGVLRIPTAERLRATGRHYIRDLVFGANDGIITTFAVVAGVAGANLSSEIVLILGIANLIADGFSMGASNFLSLRSEQATRTDDPRQDGVRDPLEHGFATFLAFVLAGLIPLIAYMTPHTLGTPPFIDAVILTAVALFTVGAARTLVYRRSVWRSGLEMLLVGAVAAAAAYALGHLLAGLAGGR